MSQTRSRRMREADKIWNALRTTFDVIPAAHEAAAIVGIATGSTEWETFMTPYHKTAQLLNANAAYSA